jgi:uncharacterized protein with HEPN domain
MFVGSSSREAFLQDPKTLKAVVADLIIIGEAARHIPNHLIHAHPEIPWELMCGMRNRIVHGYFQVDSTIVWETCQNDLPSLVVPLTQILHTLP